MLRWMLLVQLISWNEWMKEKGAAGASNHSRTRTAPAVLHNGSLSVGEGKKRKSLVRSPLTLHQARIWLGLLCFVFLSVPSARSPEISPILE